MRNIPFPAESFSFVYSWNAIFFMTKPDIETALLEMARVLRTGGLCFVNFLAMDDPDWDPFSDTSDLMPYLHSETFAHHEENETDALLEDFTLIHKEKRKFWRKDNGEYDMQSHLDYIVEKSL